MTGGALFLRRAAAYALDSLAISVYALALALVMVSAFPSLVVGKLEAYLLAVTTLTGPVILAYAGMEARFGAGPGKELLGLRVRRKGERPGFGRSLARNGLKFAPWEIAHAGIYLVPGQPFIDPPGLLSLVLWTIAMGVVAIQGVLIGVFGAGLHDWLSGLRVAKRVSAD